MSLLVNLKDAIADELETITDIGVVHRRDRYAGNDTALLSLFKTRISGVDQIRTWIVTAGATQLEHESFGTDAGGNLTGTVTIRVRGLLGFHDEDNTEDTLLGLAETALKKFGSLNIALTGAHGRILAPNISRVDVIEFGSVICNLVEITVPVLVADSADWS